MFGATNNELFDFGISPSDIIDKIIFKSGDGKSGEDCSEACKHPEKN